ncbi:hypothetical protein ZWY2020_016851 [Hordeum vulgare]|nr:hypothetical protein ZWY2020_016851 [Hordeum vulgare]
MAQAQMPKTRRSLLRKPPRMGEWASARSRLLKIFKAFNSNDIDASPLKRCQAPPRTSVASLVLELAGISAWDNKRARIMQLHFQLSVRNDYKLAQVLESVLISDGGVQPEIDTELLYNMVKAKGSA